MPEGFDRFLAGVWFAIVLIAVIYAILLAAGVDVNFSYPQ